MTLEDHLEKIVGEIDDETDKAAIDVHQIGEDTYIVRRTWLWFNMALTGIPGLKYSIG
ncbi:hypothetical protein [Neisseria lactamica]|uniref:hypothetical protein n=1 Tax=Neisseria lactamica TaxID=486 RepID=UPI001C3FACC3|nr:hypothetical protein [Neisseria lactamica]